MKVAVAWNGPASRRVFDRGLVNQETMHESDAQRVVDALTELGHESWLVEGDVDLPDQLGTRLGAEDLVFNTAYGVQGVARYTHVPGILESAGFRYTGSDPLGHALALEKPIAKTLMRAAGIPTPDWVVVERGDPVPAAVDLGFPVVVKPSREGGSLGLHLAEDRDDLEQAVDRVHETFGQDALVERFVPGKDVMVPVLGNAQPRALPCVQVETIGYKQAILTKEHKDGSDDRPSRVRCPAPLDDDTQQRLEKAALDTFEALAMRDWARIDARLTSDGRIEVLEINSLPGLGRRSSFRVSAEAAGMGFTGMVAGVVETATARWERRERRLQRVERQLEAQVRQHGQDAGGGVGL